MFRQVYIRTLICFTYITMNITYDNLNLQLSFKLTKLSPDTSLGINVFEVTLGAGSFNLTQDFQRQVLHVIHNSHKVNFTQNINLIYDS